MRAISLGIITVPTPGTPVSIGSHQAIVVATDITPFAIVVNVSDKISVGVDGGNMQTVTLTAGAARTATQVVSDINAQTSGITASVAGGKVVMASNTVGPTSSIRIEAIANDAYTVLGLSLGTSVGVSNQAGCKIRLVPLKANAADIYVGNKVNFDKTTGDGLLERIIKPLSTPSELDRFSVESSQDHNVLNTKEYFIDADTANDGVMASLWIG